MEHVAILGASEKPARYAYRAQQRLSEHGHSVYPVSAHGGDVLGVRGYRSLGDIEATLDTVTVYVNPNILEQLTDDLLAVNPRRVIFNPGTESPGIMSRLEAEGIHVQQACTLVLLSIRQFDHY